MNYDTDIAHIFTFFFIMLGPVKMIAPYAHATRMLDQPQLQALSWKAALAGALIAVAGGFLGANLLNSWGVPVTILSLGGGIIFFLFALLAVLPQGAAPAPSDDPAPPTIMQIVFPMMLTPYGLAAVIVFLANSVDANRTMAVVGLVLAIMLLNLVCMIFVRPILKFVTPVGLQIFFSILSVMLVALALSIIIDSVYHLGILSPVIDPMQPAA